MSRLERHHPPASFAGTRATTPVSAPGAPARTNLWRLALAAALLVSAAAAYLLGTDPRADAMDPDLVTVLRVSVATKGLIALCAAAAADWRLRHPIAAPTAAAVVAAASLAVAGPAFAYGLTHLETGLTLHYAGLAALALLAWRDRTAIAALLAARAYRR